jgi:hypothetical protein
VKASFKVVVIVVSATLLASYVAVALHQRFGRAPVKDQMMQFLFVFCILALVPLLPAAGVWTLQVAIKSQPIKGLLWVVYGVAWVALAAVTLTGACYRP